MSHKIDYSYIPKSKYVAEKDKHTDEYQKKRRELKSSRGNSSRKKKKRKDKKKRSVFLGKYREYIKSSVWKQKRSHRLKLDNWSCVVCGGYSHHVHHWYYTYPYGKEKKYQLASVCYRCHQHIHDHHGYITDIYKYENQYDIQIKILGLIKCIRLELGITSTTQKFFFNLSRKNI